MALFPQTRCPKCNGPVTFFEVMSIVTPFQSIDCSSCGEIVFLKHKSELFLIASGLGVLTFVVSLYVLINSILPTVVTYSAAVSYTHLDVYKRQVLTLIVAVPGTEDKMLPSGKSATILPVAGDGETSVVNVTVFV